jgi:hypothetical protein
MFSQTLLSTSADVANWCHRYSIQAHINTDLTLSVQGNLDLNNGKIDCIPVIFEQVHGHVFCQANNLDSLKNIHKRFKKISGVLWCDKNPVKSHILGVSFIRGLTGIKLDNIDVQNLINQELSGRRDGLLFQQELIEMGLDEYARW